MNIALVIFRIGPSHGSLLQTYALYRILKKMGHSVTIVNRKDKLPFKTFIKRTLYRVYHTLRGERFDYIISTELIPSRRMKNLNVFVDKYLSQDLIEFSNLKINQSTYDVFLVGSDQVWRPKFVQSISYYFLDFAKKLHNIKRVSYAASFGVDEWEYSDQETKICQELARLFDAISVREDSGVLLSSQYLGVNATHVLDPTMLLDVSDYVDLIENNSVLSPNKTLAYSVLDDNEEKISIIQNVSKLLDLEIVRIKADESKLKYVETGIEFWLDEIRKSSFVITDSFHATVFAIIFNKPFIVIGNKLRGIGRLTSLLNMFDLSNRLVYENETLDLTNIIEETISWDMVNERRCILREKSLDFIKNNIS